MRIISQDGTTDFHMSKLLPTEFRVRLCFPNKKLTGVEVVVDDMIIASYSTEAKAKKAMKMLRSHYKKNCNEEHACFQFPSDKDLED